MRAVRLFLSFALGTFVLLGASVQARAAFPGSNGPIAFERIDGIHTINPDGSGLTQITTSGADQWPRWSPDGSKLVFQRSSDVYTMNADGSNPVDVTNNPAFDANPNWSPDGTRITFDSDRNQSTSIYVMNADGTGVTLLAPGFSPSWSPDGSRIAFSRYSDLWVMNADGTGQVDLTNNPSLEYLGSDWSPDNSKIVFQAITQATGGTSVYEVNADGTGFVDLTHGTMDGMPAFSPDGTEIVFTIGGPGGHELYTMNADGSGFVDITNNPSKDNIEPDWETIGAPAPTIASFQPTRGAVGRSVTVTGTGFSGATSVTFNGIAAAFSVVSDTSITTTVPTGALTGPIGVTTPAGAATSATSFDVRPAINQFRPTSGPVGKVVQISGSAFTGATRVTFNGAPAVFTVISYSKINATVPAGATTGLISVTTAGGTGKSRLAFTVT
jgi:hypothetical protein